MAKVTFKLKGLKSLTKKQIVTRGFQKKLGERVLKEVLDSIAGGKSPVAGQGRFVGYKADRAASGFRKQATRAQRTGSRTSASRFRKQAKATASKSDLYPNSVKDKFPRKQNRPVNLELSGAMLKALKWKRITGGVRFGLLSASKKLKAIFEAHNEGTNTEKGVPRRAVLPGDGEKFTASITRRIRNLFLARIRQVLRQQRKRR